MRVVMTHFGQSIAYILFHAVFRIAYINMQVFTGKGCVVHLCPLQVELSIFTYKELTNLRVGHTPISKSRLAQFESNTTNHILSPSLYFKF